MDEKVTYLDNDGTKHEMSLKKFLGVDYIDGTYSTVVIREDMLPHLVEMLKEAQEKQEPVFLAGYVYASNQEPEDLDPVYLTEGEIAKYIKDPNELLGSSSTARLLGFKETEQEKLN